MEDALYRAGVPSSLFRRGGDTVLRETGGDVIGGFSRQKFCVDAPDDHRFLLYDLHLTIRRAFFVAEEVGVSQTHLAVCEPLALAPRGVVTDIPGLLLGKTGHDGDEQFTLGVQCVNIFLLEVNLHTFFLQFANGGRTVADLLDEIENENLYLALVTIDRRTLKIVLLKMQGYSTKEIAPIVGLTTGAVYARMGHLRKKLKAFKR